MVAPSDECLRSNYFPVILLTNKQKYTNKNNTPPCTYRRGVVIINILLKYSVLCLRIYHPPTPRTTPAASLLYHNRNREENEVRLRPITSEGPFKRHNSTQLDVELSTRSQREQPSPISSARRDPVDSVCCSTGSVALPIVGDS